MPEKKRPLHSQGTQTVEVARAAANVRSLSPFETYDLMFVKELVNNLNKDNEILNQNIVDFKDAFLYLYEKHKALAKDYRKECLNKHVIQQ